VQGLFSKPIQDTGLYASVAPDNAGPAAPTLTYIVPRELADSIAVGDRVTVPLGPGDRHADATVVGLTRRSNIDTNRLKPINSRKGTRLPFPLTDLALWIARYYAAPPGPVFTSMIPAAVRQRVGERTAAAYEPTGRNQSNPDAPLTPTALDAWQRLTQLPNLTFPAEKRSLQHALELKTAAPLNRLVKAGLLRETTITAVRPATTAPSLGLEHTDPNPHTLTHDQNNAANAVINALGSFQPFLLHGVTGSGKTEVYLHALNACLQAGNAGIVLVPEIALTPQTAGRFVARFGQQTVAVLHSGLSASRRHEQWNRLATGDAKVAVGARSAIFAPFPEHLPLGLIIVDEEHDASYKQDQTPRYHARDVALKRAQLQSCPAVLGSATPSLESWLNANGYSKHPNQRKPRYKLLSLPSRVLKTPMPRVHIVDLTEERKRTNNTSNTLTAIGPTLENHLRHTLERNAQAILLLNRRGYASYIACASPACGFTLACNNCDTHLVFHKPHLPKTQQRQAFVKCHHCLELNRLPQACPESGHKLSLLGFGTQRLEEELTARFPQLAEPHALRRLDADTMHRAADYHDALQAFRQGQTRVLIGTQMIAKGLDFPAVELVGVVNADTALAIPDFRATERTFQLVAQVAGRAGRAADSAHHARVLVQTIEPHHPAIRHAANHDFPAFANEELAIRAALDPPLPPVGRMARLLVRSTDYEQATNAAANCRRFLQNAQIHGLTIRGPFDAPIARIAKKHRIATDLQAHTNEPIQHALAHLHEIPRKDTLRCELLVDNDPLSLY